MASYQVTWDVTGPRSSYWTELAGVITYASGLLKGWVGRRHGDLVADLHRRGFYVKQTSLDCVPKTLKFHRELKANVDALLALLGEPAMGNKTIWDGKDLPEIGQEVLAQLGRSTDSAGKGGWVRHKVAGYRVSQIAAGNDPAMQKFHVRLDIILGASDDPRSSKNERNYNDIHPVDWEEPK